MRLREILRAILAVTFVTSCSSYYYVTTDVNRDLSAERTVYMENQDHVADFISTDVWVGSDVNSPFEVDFYDHVGTMKRMYRAKADEIDGFSFQPDKYQKGNPLFIPVETLSKRFRWFYSYYDYKAVFNSLAEMLPLSLDGYFTAEQKNLFFRGENPPQGWNGLEMYYLLDDVNRKFAEWYSDAVFFVMCDVFKPYCSEYQCAVLGDSKDLFMKGTSREMVFVMTPEEFEEKLVEIAPQAGFGQIFSSNTEDITEKYEKASDMISYFNYSFIYAVDMPGNYYDGNAVVFTEGQPTWKVDAFRLLDGDMVLEATFRKMNIWIFVLTFAVIAVLLQLFAKLFSKR